MRCSSLEDRLKTRFEWGLIADIQPPDYETPHGHHQEKGHELLGLELPDDVCEYIAENITTNVRQIEGTVKKILAYRDLQGMAARRGERVARDQGHVQGEGREPADAGTHHLQRSAGFIRSKSRCCAGR